MNINDLIAKYGNKGGEFRMFNKSVSYPLHSQDFIRTGFGSISPSLAARDYKDPKQIIEIDRDEAEPGWTWEVDGELYQVRVRKMTPRECFRLMAFSTKDGETWDDSLFEAAESVNSNTQLYKQAGNSIVVDCLAYILKNLLTE